MPSSTSAQSYVPDPRNDSVLVYVNGEFVPRNEARVSIFDAGFGLGDGVWEGLRLVRGKLICLDEHLKGFGLEEDIRFCAQESVLDVVPRFAGMDGPAAVITV